MIIKRNSFAAIITTTKCYFKAKFFFTYILVFDILRNNFILINFDFFSPLKSPDFCDCSVIFFFSCFFRKPSNFLSSSNFFSLTTLLSSIFSTGSATISSNFSSLISVFLAREFCSVVTLTVVVTVVVVICTSLSTGRSKEAVPRIKCVLCTKFEPKLGRHVVGIEMPVSAPFHILFTYTVCNKIDTNTNACKYAVLTVFVF